MRHLLLILIVVFGGFMRYLLLILIVFLVGL